MIQLWKKMSAAAGLLLALAGTALGAGGVYVAPDADFRNIQTIIVMPDGNGSQDFDAAAYLSNKVKKIKNTALADSRNFGTPPASLEEAGAMYAPYGQALLVPYMQEYTTTPVDVPDGTVSVRLRSYEERSSRFGTHRFDEVDRYVNHYIPGGVLSLIRVDMDFALYDMSGRLLFAYTEDRKSYQGSRQDQAQYASKNAADALKKQLS